MLINVRADISPDQNAAFINCTLLNFPLSFSSIHFNSSPSYFCVFELPSTTTPQLPIPPPSVRLHPSHVAGGDDGDARERDEIRHDRRKERQHDRNISRAAPDKRCWTRTLNTLHVNSPTPHSTICTHLHRSLLNHSWGRQ